VVNYRYAVVFVVGYRKQPKDFGLVLTDIDGRYMGVKELGVPPKEKAKVYQSAVISETKEVANISPIKCRIKYRNLTKAGLLRLPSFVEWV
jgi:DNA ligase 1